MYEQLEKEMSFFSRIIQLNANERSSRGQQSILEDRRIAFKIQMRVQCFRLPCGNDDCDDVTSASKDKGI